VDHVEATLETDKEIPLQIIFLGDLDEGIGALAGAAHEFFLRRWSVTHAAVHFKTDQFEFGSRRERGREDFQGLPDGVQLGAALAANGDDDFGHLPGRSPDCNGTLCKFSRRIFGG